jgi:hypothetical protein
MNLTPQLLPAELLKQSLETLVARGLQPTIIGSLAVLEHVDVDAARLIATEDVDLLLELPRPASVADVENAMLELGLMLPAGRYGKWLPPGGTIGVDLLARTLPSGFGSPACLEEPFANVAALDRRQAAKLPTLLSLPTDYRPTVAGPVTTVIGKALKVARYRTLPDWHTNSNRRRRAERSMWDALVVVQQNRHEFQPERIQHLAARCDEVGKDVREVLLRGVRALAELMVGEGKGGLELAKAWGFRELWDESDVVQAVIQIREGCGINSP